MHKFFLKICLFIFLIHSSVAFAEEPISVPVLVYHVLNPKITSNITITPETFESQVKWLKDNGYTVIPLQELVSYLQGKNVALPAKPVVITADDGWRSDYTYMYPIVRKYNIPVTLFIYPGTISKGKNAMTWDQLEELQKTGLFDIQSHTYTHPNFRQSKKRMSANAYENLVHKELFYSKKVLEDKLGTNISLLAWPFGIYDRYLEQEAVKAGYTMAFTIDARNASRIYRPTAQPRYMIVTSQDMEMFAAIVKGKAQGPKKKSTNRQTMN
ncbi:MAG: polysaccharide deacetylase family protein [Coxiellaceae bacterium]|nr:MAG: polysaccharide deacetylase family protein [Coxiellaceae bacterium]